MTVVALIKEYFVPVGIDWRPGGSGRKTQADRQLQKDWNLGRRSPTGLFVLEPDGKMVAFGSGGTGEAVARFLRESLGQLGPLPTPRNAPPRSVNPDRGVGVGPGGSLRLAVTARAVKPGPRASGGTTNYPPMLDSASLTRAQARALAPARAEVGLRYTLPEEVSRQFAPALSTGGDAYYRMRPQDATVARLEAEVISVSEDRIEVRVGGTLNGQKSFGDQGKMETNAAVDGLVVFGRSGELQSLRIICEGRHVNTRSNSNTLIGGLIEWELAAPEPSEGR